MSFPKMYQILNVLIACIVLIATSGTQAYAVGSDCGEVHRGASDTFCEIRWVEDDTLRTLVWRKSTEVDGLTVEGQWRRFIVRSPEPPHLADIDHDGFADMVFFEQLGMVNGSFTFLRFDPDRGNFTEMGIATGHGFYLDRSGFIVTTGRSSCCESWAEFYEIKDNLLSLAFQMDIRPEEISEPDTQCVVHREWETYDHPRNAYPDMIAAFCNYYENGGSEELWARDWQSQTFPTNHFKLGPRTVFFCLLNGGTRAVTINRREGDYTYLFGGLGLAPDLQLFRDDNTVVMENSDSAAGSLTGFIDYQNGDYTYTLHSPRNAFGPTGSPDALYRLTASRTDEDGFAFDETCLPDAVYDDTFLWIAG